MGVADAADVEEDVVATRLSHSADELLLCRWNQLLLMSRRNVAAADACAVAVAEHWSCVGVDGVEMLLLLKYLKLLKCCWMLPLEHGSCCWQTECNVADEHWRWLLLKQNAR
jgi:hypothetical protein